MRLAELAATRILDRVECDVDYEEAANAWFDGFLSRLRALSVGSHVVEPEKESVADTPTFSKANPFPALLQTNRLLNGPESSKETRHFEISLAGSGLEYEAGDALVSCRVTVPISWTRCLRIRSHRRGGGGSQ